MDLKRLLPAFLLTPAVPDEFREPVKLARRRDLIARQKPGIFYYPAIWFIITALIMLESQTPMQLRNWLLVIASTFVITSFFRHLCVLYYERRIREPTYYSELPLVIGILPGAFGWGLVMAAALLPTPLHPHMPLIWVSSLGLCAGGITSLSISSVQSSVFLGCMLLPSVLVSLSGLSLESRSLAVVLVVFALSMAAISRFPRREYHTAVVNNLKLQKQAKALTALTTLDGLTGVRNRRFFDETLKAELQRAGRLGYPISLLMVDIDYFKRINDEHGHLLGDQCLVHAARMLKQQLKRSSDFVARYGGEEFAVILPGSGEEEAAERAESLRHHIANNLAAAVGLNRPITISIGGATLAPSSYIQTSAIVALADQALYGAKLAGRDRVHWARPDGSNIAARAITAT